jgi:hypothetical protein
MRDYLSKAKTICDQLACAGHKITDTEQILCMLGGLDDEYEAVVAIISSNEKLPSLQSVHAMLLAHKGRIKQKKSTNLEYNVNHVSANRNRNQEKNQSNRNQSNNYRGGQSSRGRNRGGRWNYNNNSRPRCQICERYGHTANKCYFRFDANFTLAQQSNNNIRPQNPSANMINMHQ